MEKKRDRRGEGGGGEREKRKQLRIVIHGLHTDLLLLEHINKLLSAVSTYIQYSEEEEDK